MQGYGLWFCVGCAATQTAESSETARLNGFFEEVFQKELANDPVRMTYLGMADRKGEWTDVSDTAGLAELERTRGYLERLQGEFDPELLDGEGRLSYELFVYNAEQELAGEAFRLLDYPVNQMHGVHKAPISV